MKLFRIIFFVILLVPLAVIWIFWFQTSGAFITRSLSDGVIGIGRLFGLTAVYFVLMQVFFRARIMPAEKIVGYETMNYLHKKNGYLVYSLILLHPIFITIGYSLTSSNNIFVQFYTFLLTYPGVLKAFLAVLLFTGVVISSVYMVRKKLPYELWYFVHLTTYIAILFAWDHQLKIGTDFQLNQWFVYFWYVMYVVIFGSLLYWRFWRQLYVFSRQRFYVEKIVREASDTHSLYIGGRNIQNFRFAPGQFAFLRFLSKNTWWESHPFSFSHAAGKDLLRFTIKSSGDFTEKLPSIKPKTPIIIDGPHGEFTLEKVKNKKILLIAGGVGITPLRSLLEQAEGRSMVLFYSNKDEKDIILKSEVEKLSKEKGVQVFYVISQNPNYRGLKGRINLEMIRSIIKDVKKYDVFICGPLPMLESLKKEFLTIMPREQIHTEEFAL